MAGGWKKERDKEKCWPLTQGTTGGARKGGICGLTKMAEKCKARRSRRTKAHKKNETRGVKGKLWGWEGKNGRRNKGWLKCNRKSMVGKAKTQGKQGGLM